MIVAHQKSLAQVALASKLRATEVVPGGVAQALALASLERVTAAPAMPRRLTVQQEHRSSASKLPLIYPAAIARRVPTNEWQLRRFRLVLDKEWNKLKTVSWPDKAGTRVWNEKLVRKASDVREEARKGGFDVHLGRIVELCYEKGAELAEDDEERKAKGRAVFLGVNVRDQDWQYALFEDHGSAPPSIEAAKALDAFSLFPGNEQTPSDAVSAYTQSFLRGTPTYVALPHDRWPPE